MRLDLIFCMRDIYINSKGTCKNHEFVPGGENIGFKNLLIQQKSTVLSIKHIIPRLFYACSHDDEWRFAVAKLCFGRIF